MRRRATLLLLPQRSLLSKALRRLHQTNTRRFHRAIAVRTERLCLTSSSFLNDYIFDLLFIKMRVMLSDMKLLKKKPNEPEAAAATIASGAVHRQQVMAAAQAAPSHAALHAFVQTLRGKARAPVWAVDRCLPRERQGSQRGHGVHQTRCCLFRCCC